MTLFILYFIKVNIALAVMYCFYKLLFSKDTFFGLRRLMLILIYITAFTYPLFNLSGWVAIADSSVARQVISTLYQKVLPEITILGNNADETATHSHIGTILIGIYAAGVLILLTRTLLEIWKTHLLLRHSEKTTIDGIRVCLIEQKEEPYSFFQWIYLHPDMHNAKELKEILAHEQTHVRELHSADVLLAQTVIILCWFNPFAWLLRSEMRINHEYLADSKVIANGYDKKTYQYHLIGLEHTQPAAANLYNNFSVLPLKNRIKMLNRKRTRSIMKSKYLMFIPVTALLILFSNCTTTTDKETEQKEAVDAKFLPVEVRTDSLNNAGNEVLDLAETMPEFKGGMNALLKYLSDNIKYPKTSEKAGIQGRVVVQFVVAKDGSIEDTKVVRGVDPELDKEALRVVNAMPKWKPGMQDGKPVRVKYTVPIMFRLQ